MAGQLLRISMEPAPGYLPFVESHLAALRRDAQRLTGDGSIAEEVSSGALTDVALRWYWFELLRVALGRPDPAGAYLDVALTRRCARRLGQPDDVRFDVDMDMDVVVEPVEPVAATPAAWPTIAATGWRPEPAITVVADPPAPRPPRESGSRAPATSAAARIATVGPEPPPAPSAVLEAVIAWLHAYHTFVRCRRIAALTMVVIVMLLLAKLRIYGAAL